MVGAEVAASMAAMVLARVVYWVEAGSQVSKYSRRVGRVQRAASP